MQFDVTNGNVNLPSHLHLMLAVQATRPLGSITFGGPISIARIKRGCRSPRFWLATGW